MMVKNRIVDNGAAEDTVKTEADPKAIMAEQRARVLKEFNAKLNTLCDEYGIDIVPAGLQARFRA